MLIQLPPKLPDLVSRDAVDVYYFPNLFRPGYRLQTRATAGDTVAEILERIGWSSVQDHGDTRVSSGHDLVPPENYATQVVNPLHPLVVRMVPAGPVAAIFFFIQGFFATLASFGGAGAAGNATASGLVQLGLSEGAAGLIGSFVTAGVATFQLASVFMSFNGLNQPPTGRFGGGGQSGRISPNIAQVGNSTRPGAPLPTVYGTHLVMPTPLSLPYTENVGSRSFLRILLGVSYGPGIITDLKFGEVAEGDIDELQTQIRPGEDNDPEIKLYTRQVFQTAPGGSGFQFPVEPSTVGSGLVDAAKLSTVPGAGDGFVDEISVDYQVAGNFRSNENGKRRNFAFGIRIRFRKDGGAYTDAVDADNFTGLSGTGNPEVRTFQLGPTNKYILLQGRLTEPYTKTFRWEVPFGNGYEVETTRFEFEPPNARPGGRDTSGNLGAFTWSVVRGFRNEQPFTRANYATISARIPITDLVGGRPGTISCLWSRKLRVYDPYGLTGGSVDSDEWTLDPFETANPAAAVREELQGASTIDPIEDARIDIDALSTFFLQCEPPIIDSLDSAAAITITNGTKGINAIIKIEGTASVTGTSDSASPCTLALSNSQNGRNQFLVVHVRVVNLGILTATDGIRIRATNSDPTRYTELTFGTDDILGEPNFNRLICDLSDSSKWVGPFDPGLITDIEFSFNHFNGAASNLVYFDLLQLGRYLEYSNVHDFRSTLFENLQAIASAGFGRVLDLNGKITVKADHPQATIKQLIVPRNSSAFNLERMFQDKANGVKVFFTDPDKGFEPNQMQIAYADGFSADGAGGTTIAEAKRIGVLRLPGAYTRQDAWGRGRRFLAQAQLQPRLFKVTLGLESLAADLGDRVELAHDAALIGDSWGRVKVADDPITIDDAESLTDWVGVAATIALNADDAQEGTSAIRATATGTGAYGAQYNPPGGDDYSLTPIFRWFTRSPADDVLSDVDGDRFTLLSAGASSTWYIGALDTARAGRKRQQEIDTANETPDETTGGGVDFSAVTGLRFTFRELSGGLVGSTAAVDFLERLDPTRVSRLVVDSASIMEGGVSYQILIRVLDEATPAFTFQTLGIFNPLGEFDPPQQIFEHTLASPVSTIPLPAKGDVYAFGRTDQVTRSCMITAITRGKDFESAVEMVDYNPSTYIADRTLIPAFDPGQSDTVPRFIRGPAKPVIVDIVTDERALAFNSSGALLARMIIELAMVPDNDRPPAEFIDVQLRVNNSTTGGLTEYRSFGRFNVSERAVIDDVEEGEIYDVRVRSLSEFGQASEFEVRTAVLVIGKSTPPADVTNLRIEQGNFVWNYPFGIDGNIDLDGFDLRVNPGIDTFFDGGTRLMSAGNLVKAPPFPIDRVPLGNDVGAFTVMIKAVDVGGNSSVNQANIFANLGIPVVGNVSTTVDLDTLGFPRKFIERVIDDFDDAFADRTPWTIVNGTFENSAFSANLQPLQPGLSFLITADSTASIGFSRPLEIVPTDYTGRKVHCFVRVEDGASLSTGDGVRLRVSSNSDPNQDYIEERFGTNDGLVAGDGVFYEVIFDTDTPQITVGSPDITLIQTVHLTLNTGGTGAADRQFYLDALFTTDGTSETTLVEGGSGNLVTRTNDKFWNNDNALFWSGDNTADFYTASYLAGEYRFQVKPPQVFIPANLSFLWNDPGVNAQLTYRTFGDHAFWVKTDPTVWWGPDDSVRFWDQVSVLDFSPVPSTIPVTRERYEFQLFLGGGRVQGRITNLDVKFDVPDVLETFSDLAIPSAGGRIPITKTFREITGVQLTLLPNTVGQQADSVFVLDKDPVLGPLVQGVRNNQDNACDVDVIVQGF